MSEALSGPHDVEAVMVDGRWLRRDGALLTRDEAAIVQEATRIGRAAWQRLLAAQPALVPPAGFHGNRLI
jgi:5-methylthioadenosine/S-adenosylhomocysteine deaminase